MDGQLAMLRFWFPKFYEPKLDLESEKRLQNLPENLENLSSEYGKLLEAMKNGMLLFIL